MSEATKQPSAPYVPYETFKSSVRGLGKAGQLPDRIDNTVFPSMSGSGRSQLMQAFRYFRLIDDKGKPNDELPILANSTDEEWNALLGEILSRSYPDQLKALESGTEGSFKESFRLNGGAITIPAARFLLAAARDVGLKISAHIKNIKGGERKKNKSVDAPAPESGAVNTQKATPTTGNAMVDALLSKFPEFDPNWTEQQQERWFSAYNKLLSMPKGGNDP